MLKKGVERREVLRALGEVFRAHGYEGASLTLITEATGLGKGSLYHLFPGGKEQMAAEVLADIDAWFELNIYAPLREASAFERVTLATAIGIGTGDCERAAEVGPHVQGYIPERIGAAGNPPQPIERLAEDGRFQTGRADAELISQHRIYNRRRDRSNGRGDELRDRQVARI